MHAFQRATAVMAVVAVALIGAAACGSSSSKSTAKAPAASTPAAPATPTATSTSAAISQLPGNTPITDPKYHAGLASYLEQQLHISSAGASAAATCVIQKLQSKGLKTGGQVTFADGKAAGVECATEHGGYK